MGFVYEDRDVTERKRVPVWTCDSCGTKVESSTSEFASPDGWFSVTGDRHGSMCSEACLRAWASGSDEMTKIAREAFDRQTSGIG